jgi:tetratricopeptide (TPR) repeat protein
MNAGEALNMAIRHHRAGDLRSAEVLYRQVLQMVPRQVDALHLLGVVAHQVGRHDLALDFIRQALQENPSHAEAHCNLSSVLLALGRLDEAAASCRRAVQLKPDYVEAHFNLGNILRDQNKAAEAAVCYEQALRLRPHLVEARNSLGGVLKMQGQEAEAIAHWQRVIAERPDHSVAHNNLATAYVEQGRLAEALAGFDRAVMLQPDNVDYHFNRSLLWLLQGNFTRGWAEYEWRWRRPTQPPRPFAQPLWQGEPLTGRTILIHAEQGLGDTLHMVRYLRLVWQRGPKAVVLECQPPLLRLLTHSLGQLVDRVVPQGDVLPHFDTHVPTFNLPRLLGTMSVQQIPGDVPYLHTEPARVAQWRDRLNAASPGRALRVGIVWQGNPENKEDKRRSVTLGQFEILNIPDVKLFSLQKGYGRDQLADFSHIVDLGSELSDFADTAAVLQNLDLVITIDTAVAHLAGALGRTAWVVLPFVPDWRWSLQRSDCAWYPSLRLFRQSRAGDWGEVFQRLRKALAELVNQRQ